MQQGRHVALGSLRFPSDRRGCAVAFFSRLLVILNAMFFVFGGQVIHVAEFGVETQRTVVCVSCDVIVRETSFRWQIETMLLQGACKRLYNANSRPAPLMYPRSSSVTHLHLAVPLTSCTPQVPSIFQHHSPASRCASHILDPSLTLDLPAVTHLHLASCTSHVHSIF